MEQPESVSLYDFQVPENLPGSSTLVEYLSRQFQSIRFILTPSNHLYCRSNQDGVTIQSLLDDVDHFRMTSCMYEHLTQDKEHPFYRNIREVRQKFRETRRQQLQTCIARLWKSHREKIVQGMNWGMYETMKGCSEERQIEVVLSVLSRRSRELST